MAVICQYILPAVLLMGIEDNVNNVHRASIKSSLYSGRFLIVSSRDDMMDQTHVQYFYWQQPMADT